MHTSPSSADPIQPLPSAQYNNFMGKLWTITIVLLVLGGAMGYAQEYNGPPPPKADIPYLLHAENLIETEVSEAKEEERNRETANIIPGANSPVRTPLAEPIFILLAEELAPEKLELYKAEVVKGQREVTFPNDPKRRMRRGPHPLHLAMKELDNDLYWIEANEILENGEYCLTPGGSQAVFCFQVY